MRAQRFPRFRRRNVVVGVLLAIVLLAVAVGASSAFAAETCSSCKPWWHLGSSSAPTNLPPGQEVTIVATATNLGDGEVKASPTAPVTITDKLPAGLVVTGLNPTICNVTAPQQHMCAKRSPSHGNKAQDITCNPATVSCDLRESMAPYEGLEMDITVKVEEPLGTVRLLPNEVTIQGGGAEPESIVRQLKVNGAPTPFGIENYEVSSENDAGGSETQAGAHPFQLTTTFSLNESVFNFPGKGVFPSLPELPKNVHVNLPPGLIGNPIGVPQCSEIDFTTHPTADVNLCPGNTAIGVAVVRVNEPLTVAVITAVQPVFNLHPAEGEPARFGFQAFNVPVTLDTVVREGDYHVVVNASNIPQSAALLSSEVTVWGVPGDSRHNQSRGFACLAEGASAQGQTCEDLGVHPQAFLSLPTSCKGPLQTSASAQSWLPGAGFLDAVSPAFTGTHEGTQTLQGCEKLPFNPTMEVQPQQHESNTPTGLTVDLKVPQESTLDEKGLAESNIKDTTVALPPGMQLSPSAADGLAACSLSDIGFTGTNSITGTNEFNSEPAKCPAASKVGTVTIHTPVLEHELHGSVYLAAQNDNPFGSLFGLYIVVEDPISGVLAKIAGRVDPVKATGQVISTFPNAPQLLFDELKLELSNGPRSSVATPRSCGNFTTQATLTPWSGTAPAELSLNPQQFNITSGPHGTPCASVQPFNPGIVAGTTNNQAGAFTPFSLTLTRPDTDQQVKSLSVTLPPGLAGIVKNVSQCPEAQANAGTCGPESLIGHATASSGLGSDPFTITGGRVYLTEKYKGAPFGLSIVIPAKAGPFDFGNVVTRSTITVDRNTAAITINTPDVPTMVVTDRYPEGVGVPVQLRRIDVTVERPEFQFNPTNCSPLKITGAIGGDQGASAPIAVPFQAANCNKLPFAPTLTAETSSNVTKTNGTSLVVKVTSGPGQANIGKTKIVFPEQLPSRLTTIQKACPDSVFEANPATCPEGSVIGTATAHTPVLAGPLTGPAYLVSHGGAAFPDAEFVLQGEGITLVLDGKTDIKKGITSSEFNTVPDAPVSTFVVTLPAGPHSAFTGHGDLCKPVKAVTKKVLVAKRVKRGKKTRTIKVRKTVTVNVADPLKLPTILTGQNGNVIEKSTPLTVTGCKAVKGFKTTKHKAKKKKKSKKKTSKKK
ncbi:MAG: hypothetical protein QOI89_432 [Solirubrobacteraceae bacterium]|nr:hypothetical protein [Solirubrobacteraceae bacterium]